MQLVKATPVASFIILALLWVRSKNLSILISFLMVLPVVYSSILEGLSNLDWQLGEMARVFRIPWGRRVRCIWLPQIWPYLIQSCRVGLGICWKSGVAAEVIGLPSGSLGDALYQAKIYLQTDDLFAWTFVIVCASALFEQCFLWLCAESDKTDGKGWPMLRFENICKSYGTRQVLKNVSGCAASFCALTAPSGSSKTTLIRILLGLECPDSGTVHREGAMSAVFQEDRLCGYLTATQNIGLVLPRETIGGTGAVRHGEGWPDGRDLEHPGRTALRRAAAKKLHCCVHCLHRRRTFCWMSRLPGWMMQHWDRRCALPNSKLKIEP